MPIVQDSLGEVGLALYFKIIKRIYNHDVYQFSQALTIISLQDVIGRNTIIIHPGSLYVRIGRASDVNPTTVLHAIARKRHPAGKVHADSMLPVTSHRVSRRLTLL